MSHLKNILVPVDLSARSVGFAQYVSRFVKGKDFEVLFLHVIGPDWKLTSEQENARVRILEVIRESPGSLQFRTGEPSSVILDVAREEAVDLIMMSPRKVPASSRLFGHSITTRILRTAACPVWMGFGDLPLLSTIPIRNVLCGLSLGPRSTSVLRWASSLTAELGATLSIVHASKRLESAPHYPFDREWRLCLERRAKADIHDVQAAAATNAEVWLGAARPLAAIPQVAKRLGTDLLVIGKSPQKRLLPDLRMLSYELGLRAPCPIVSV
jgi:nucleotide-binding universal stress UspA family protein